MPQDYGYDLIDLISPSGGNIGGGSNFLDYFNQIQRQLPTGVDPFINTESPEYLRYNELASSPVGSEEMIRDYISRAPSHEEYNPGLGRKMASFLLGTLSGGGYGAARKHLYAPLEEGISDWQREGKNIATRANLMEKDRNRQLSALRFALQQQASQARAETSSELRQQAEARRIAAEVSDNEERAKQEEYERAREGRLDEMRAGQVSILDEMRRNREERAERDQELQEESAERKRVESQEKEAIKDARLAAAMREFPTGDFEDEDVLTWLASRLAFENPLWKESMIKLEPDYQRDFPIYQSAEGIDPSQEEALRDYIKELIRRIKAGEVEY